MIPESYVQSFRAALAKSGAERTPAEVRETMAEIIKCYRRRKPELAGRNDAEVWNSWRADLLKKR